MTPHVRQVPLKKSWIPGEEVGKLAHYPVVAYEAGGQFIVLARSAGSAPLLQGTLSGQFTRVEGGDDVWGMAFEIEDLERSILDVAVMANMKFLGYRQFRGSAVAITSVTSFRAGHSSAGGS